LSCLEWGTTKKLLGEDKFRLTALFVVTCKNYGGKTLKKVGVERGERRDGEFLRVKCGEWGRESPAFQRLELMQPEREHPALTNSV